MARVEIYLQSELVGIASVNRDGAFAIEGFPSGKRIAAGAAPDGATADQRMAGLMAIQNYPYCWCERVDDRGLFAKALRVGPKPLPEPLRPTPRRGNVPPVQRDPLRSAVRQRRGEAE